MFLGILQTVKKHYSLDLLLSIWYSLFRDIKKTMIQIKVRSSILRKYSFQEVGRKLI